MLAAFQQLISHRMKHCLASAVVCPTVVESVPPDFIDLVRLGCVFLQ